MTIKIIESSARVCHFDTVKNWPLLASSTKMWLPYRIMHPSNYRLAEENHWVSVHKDVNVWDDDATFDWNVAREAHRSKFSRVCSPVRLCLFYDWTVDKHCGWMILNSASLVFAGASNDCIQVLSPTTQAQCCAMCTSLFPSTSMRSHRRSWRTCCLMGCWTIDCVLMSSCWLRWVESLHQSAHRWLAFSGKYCFFCLRVLSIKHDACKAVSNAAANRKECRLLRFSQAIRQ